MLFVVFLCALKTVGASATMAVLRICQPRGSRHRPVFPCRSDHAASQRKLRLRICVSYSIMHSVPLGCRVSRDGLLADFDRRGVEDGGFAPPHSVLTRQDHSILWLLPISPAQKS